MVESGRCNMVDDDDDGDDFGRYSKKGRLRRFTTRRGSVPIIYYNIGACNNHNNNIISQPWLELQLDAVSPELQYKPDREQ